MRVSRFGFGTASLHHLFRKSDRLALLHAALDAGFTHYDTARMYGEGLAERTLGEFLSDGLRSQVTIATKLGFPAKTIQEHIPILMYINKSASTFYRRLGMYKKSRRVRELSPSTAEISLCKSLHALRTDWVDILFIHEPQPTKVDAIRELSPWLLKQKEKGRVRYLGLAGDAANCVEVARHIHDVFDILQVEDSLEGREADIVREAGWPLQIAYGYLRRSLQQQMVEQVGALDVLRQAMKQNDCGMILVSTRKIDRLQRLASLAEE